MKNIRFLFKLIFALIPVIALLAYTLLMPFAYMDSEYPAWEYTKRITHGKLDPFSSSDFDGAFSDSETNKTTLILGDSRAMAGLNPAYMNNNTVNLAFGGATSVEMYYALTNYIDSTGTPDEIVLMFAPFHYSIIDNFWTRSAYFNYYSISELFDIYNSAHAAKSETLLKDNYAEDLISYKLRMPVKYLPALLNAKFITRKAENNEIYESLILSKGNSEFGHDKGNSELCYETSYTKMHDTGDAILIDMYINRILKLCTDKEIKTTVAVPPMNESSFNALNESYKIDFKNYMNALQNKYPQIKIHGDLIFMDDKYFGDSSHLNEEGAIEFTKNFMNTYND